jgi:hypothetical protein
VRILHLWRVCSLISTTKPLRLNEVLFWACNMYFIFGHTACVSILAMQACLILGIQRVFQFWACKHVSFWAYKVFQFWACKLVSFLGIECVLILGIQRVFMFWEWNVCFNFRHKSGFELWTYNACISFTYRFCSKHFFSQSQ